MKIEKKTKVFQISMSIQDMIDDLVYKTGASTESEIFRRGIEALHRQYFKDYIEVQKNRNSRTPESKAKEIVEKQRLKEQAKETYGRSICELLDGEEHKEGDYIYCKWNTYDMISPKNIRVGEMDIALEDLNDEYIEKQYIPSKKEVLPYINK